jgi:hypothetical protein
MAQPIAHALESSTLGDILERVLDKGVVIAGDIKIKLVDIELLTIQIRLMIASVEKAREMGMDWWLRNPDFSSAAPRAGQDRDIKALKEKIAALERRLPPSLPPAHGLPAAGFALGAGQPVTSSVRRLRLPRKVLRALENAGIHTVPELARKSRRELAAIPGVGRSCVAAVIKAAKAAPVATAQC